MVEMDNSPFAIKPYGRGPLPPLHPLPLPLTPIHYPVMGSLHPNFAPTLPNRQRSSSSPRGELASRTSKSKVCLRSTNAQAIADYKIDKRTLESPPMAVSPWPKSAIYDRQRIPNFSSGLYCDGGLHSETTSYLSYPQLSVSDPGLGLVPMLPTPRLDASSISAVHTQAPNASSIFHSPPTPVLSNSIHSRSFSTPPLLSSTSGHFDIPTPLLHQPPLSPYIQLLNYVSMFETSDSSIFLWPPLEPIPQPSRTLTIILTRRPAPSKHNILQVSQESLMSLHHDLSETENAMVTAHAEQTALDADIEALEGFLVIGRKENDVNDGPLSENCGVRMAEVENGGPEVVQGGVIAIGDVKCWVKLKELKMERTSNKCECTTLASQNERQKRRLRTLEGDVEFLRMMTLVERALETGFLRPSPPNM